MTWRREGDVMVFAGKAYVWIRNDAGRFEAIPMAKFYEDDE